jgi:hypothetical protein
VRTTQKFIGLLSMLSIVRNDLNDYPLSEDGKGKKAEYKSTVKKKYTAKRNKKNKIAKQSRKINR